MNTKHDVSGGAVPIHLMDDQAMIKEILMYQNDALMTTTTHNLRHMIVRFRADEINKRLAWEAGLSDDDSDMPQGMYP